MNLKRPLIISLVLLSITLLMSVDPSFLSASESPSERAREILKKIDDLWRGDSSHGILTMKVQTKNYTRTIKMEGWSKGKDKSLVRIISPLKERGTATLKSENSFYTYLPKTDRTIRLNSGMMMGSWMGSHFTNDDLVKDSRLEDDFDPSISFEGLRDGQKVLEFTLMPKPEAAVVWGKIVIMVRQSDYIPLTEIFYDEDLAITRTMTFTDVKILGGRKFPSVLKVVPTDKPREFTQMVYEEMTFNIDIKDSFFSLSQLKRR